LAKALDGVESGKFERQLSNWGVKLKRTFFILIDERSRRLDRRRDDDNKASKGAESLASA
jgi:polyphosphate kinase 2 (PPK2 family)